LDLTGKYFQESDLNENAQYCVMPGMDLTALTVFCIDCVLQLFLRLVKLLDSWGIRI